MERPQTLSNLWTIVQFVGWILALDCVADLVSERHYHTLLRRMVLIFVDRDPAQPRAPDSWEEWYNS